MKCDKRWCSEQVFRGRNICKGFYKYRRGFGFFSYDYVYGVCPCACHEGVTEEETLKAIEEDKKMMI